MIILQCPLPPLPILPSRHQEMHFFTSGDCYDLFKDETRWKSRSKKEKNLFHYSKKKKLVHKNAIDQERSVRINRV